MTRSSPPPRGDNGESNTERGADTPHTPRERLGGAGEVFPHPKRVLSSPSPSAGSRGLLTFIPVVVELVELLGELCQRLLDGLCARHRERKPPLEVLHLVHLPFARDGRACGERDGSGGWNTPGWGLGPTAAALGGWKCPDPNFHPTAAIFWT